MSHRKSYDLTVQTDDFQKFTSLNNSFEINQNISENMISDDKSPSQNIAQGRCPDDSGGISLKRNITLFQAVSLIVGSIIGSGIFVSPGGVLSYVGSSGAALILWLISGLLCTVGALCFAELGTMFPASGGEYTYIYHAFGDIPAFLTLWVNILIIRPGAQAVVALAFAEYSLALSFPNCEAPRLAVIFLAVVSLSLLTFVNCVSVRLAMRIQTVFTTAKLVALVAIIFAGLIHWTNGHSDYSNFSMSKPDSAGGVAMAFYSGLFAYAGWNYVNFATEELKDPQKNLPLSIGIALPVVTIIYVLANVSYLLVLSPQEIVSSQAVAVLFAQRAMGRLQYAIPVFVAFSTFGSLNGILFTSGRLFLTAARNGHLPPVMAYISIKHRTPIPALLVTCSLSYLLMGFGIFFLINCLSFVLWLSIDGAILALIYLRIAKPELHRPIKVNLALPVIFLGCCIALLVLPTLSEPKSSGLAMLLTLAGIPVYFFGVWIRNKKNRISDLFKSFEIILQKLLLVVPVECDKEIPANDA